MKLMDRVVEFFGENIETILIVGVIVSFVLVVVGAILLRDKGGDDLPWLK